MGDKPKKEGTCVGAGCTMYGAPQHEGLCSQCYNERKNPSKKAPAKPKEPDLIAKRKKPPRKLAIPAAPVIYQEVQPPKGCPDEEVQWRLDLKIGDSLDGLDPHGVWYAAEILAISTDGMQLFVTYPEWNNEAYDEWFHRFSEKIARPTTKAKPRLITQYENLSAKLTENCINFRPVPPLVADSKRSAGVFELMAMPGDNQCLFHTIYYLCDSRDLNREPGPRARIQRLRAFEFVRDKPELFKDYLHVPLEEYKTRVLHPAEWGEALELQVFSRLFECEIYSFDKTQPGVYTFGTGMGYVKRVFLVYSGSHYDALHYKEFGSNGDTIQEFFSTQDATAIKWAQDCVETLYRDFYFETYGEKVTWKVTWMGSEDEKSKKAKVEAKGDGSKPATKPEEDKNKTGQPSQAPDGKTEVKTKIKAEAQQGEVKRPAPTQPAEQTQLVTSVSTPSSTAAPSTTTHPGSSSTASLSASVGTTQGSGSTSASKMESLLNMLTQAAKAAETEPAPKVTTAPSTSVGTTTSTQPTQQPSQPVVAQPEKPPQPSLLRTLTAEKDKEKPKSVTPAITTASAKPLQRKSHVLDKQGNWECPACTYHNTPTDLKCGMCAQTVP